MDHHEEAHRIAYPGESSRANAASNQKPEFQAGFAVGKAAATKTRIQFDNIVCDEWERRGKPMDEPDFTTWRRGAFEGWAQSQS